MNRYLDVKISSLRAKKNIERLQNDFLNVLRLIGENISLCGMKIVVGTHIQY